MAAGSLRASVMAAQLAGGRDVARHVSVADPLRRANFGTGGLAPPRESARRVTVMSSPRA